MSSNAAALIDPARLWERHMLMARHGATAKGGVNRQALSAEDVAARRALIEWGYSLGLQAATDPAGNLFLRLAGSDAQAAPVMTGSHIDSQPTGGKFDGVYGVLAGLEAIAAIRAAGVAPRRSIEVVAWMNEEGSRFAPGMMGSSVFSGVTPLEDILGVVDAQGVTVKQALGEVLAAFPGLPVWPLRRKPHAYVEAHIEQGPILEREGCTIGVVSGIQGKRTFAVTVTGEEAHAGTSRRRERKDALLDALAVIQALAVLCEDEEDVTKFTVGRLEVKPNAPSVVPAQVTFSIDLRHPDSAVLQRLGDQVAPVCAAHAAKCSVSVRELSTAMSLEFPAAIRDLIRSVARDQSISHMDILSSAGHDARYLHAVCTSGMIFVPCKGGISHNEAESATRDDLANGTRVLVETLLRLAA
jgi:beta-ureidopropionase / N-carbamoyl-L-amino-acid hydrolase